MRRVAIGAANVIAPVFATTEVVPLFLTRMAAKTGLSYLFRRFVRELNNLGLIAFCDVVLTRTMTSFAAGDLALPAADLRKRGMGGVRVRFELVFVAVFAGFAADVTRVSNLHEHCRLRLRHNRLRLSRRRTNGLRTPGRSEPDDHAQY